VKVIFINNVMKRCNEITIFCFSLLVVSCYESLDNRYDQNTDAAFDNFEENINDMIIDDIIREENFSDEVNIEETAGECVFNQNPVWMEIEGMGCELIDEMEEGEWVVNDIFGQLHEINERNLIIHTYDGEDVQLLFGGLEKSDFVHNLYVNVEIKVSITIYNNAKCVKGVLLTTWCGFSVNNIMILRDGDFNNPLYPREENTPFYSLLMPFEINNIESTCNIGGDIPPDCDVQKVYDLWVKNVNDEYLTLSQGESGLLSDGFEIGDTIYRVMNNYSYYSEDCGAENLGYFIQMFDPPYWCGI